MTEEALNDLIYALDSLVIDIQGSASALTGINSEEVSHDCQPGCAWLANENYRLVNQLRKLTDSIFEAAKGPQPSLKAVGEGGLPT